MIRKEIHTRCDFASRKLTEHAERLAQSLKQGSIAGVIPQRHINKINQANRIWFYYCKQFAKAIKKQ